MSESYNALAVISVGFAIIAIIKTIIKNRKKQRLRMYHEQEQRCAKQLRAEILNASNLTSWPAIPFINEEISVKSRATLEKYDKIKFLKERKD